MNARPAKDPGHARARENDGPGGAAREAAPSGEHLKDAIRREAVAVLVVLGRGRGNAIRGRLLAGAVAERLQDQGIDLPKSLASLQRTMRDELVAAIEAGEQIASASSPPYGYYVPETESEIREGGREIWSRVAALAKRGRKYDQATADRLLEVLGQLGIGEKAA